jgi:hypothetical protein
LGQSHNGKEGMGRRGGKGPMRVGWAGGGGRRVDSESVRAWPAEEGSLCDIEQVERGAPP